jgi:hypothetical protein
MHVHGNSIPNSDGSKSEERTTGLAIVLHLACKYKRQYMKNAFFVCEDFRVDEKSNKKAPAHW